MFARYANLIGSFFRQDSGLRRRFRGTANRSRADLDIIRAECRVSHEFRKKLPESGKFRGPVECRLIVSPSNFLNPFLPVDNSRFWNSRCWNLLGILETLYAGKHVFGWKNFSAKITPWLIYFHELLFPTCLYSTLWLSIKLLNP